MDYIDNEDFLKHMIKWKKKWKRKPLKTSIDNYIGKNILLIVDNLVRKPNFSGYTFKSEMKMNAYTNCVKYSKNFNPDKSKNPFAFFTQIAFNSFLKIINDEKKKSEFNKEFLDNLITNSCISVDKKNKKDIDNIFLIDKEELEMFRPIKITKDSITKTYHTEKDYLSDHLKDDEKISSYKKFSQK